MKPKQVKVLLKPILRITPIPVSNIFVLVNAEEHLMMKEDGVLAIIEQSDK